MSRCLNINIEIVLLICVTEFVLGLCCAIWYPKEKYMSKNKTVGLILKEKFAFLSSVRFWKLTAIGILIALEAEGVIDGGVLETITRLLEIVLGGSIAIRTVDRFAEKVGGK